jgi:predicted component of viral defense system (DUF524 family)
LLFSFFILAFYTGFYKACFAFVIAFLPDFRLFAKHYHLHWLRVSLSKTDPNHHKHRAWLLHRNYMSTDGFAFVIAFLPDFRLFAKCQHPQHVCQSHPQ